MNKTITTEFANRMEKCVFEMKNKTNFYESTGIHYSTAHKIIERKWADDEQIAAIEKFCDEVEGVTEKPAA